MASVLDDKARAEFAEAARALPSGGDEGEIETEPAADAGASSDTPNAAEPAGAAKPEAASDAGENPPADERPPQHVPYPRFKEVNDRNKELLARQAEFEKSLGDIDAAAKARAADYLRTIAERNPELRNYILGEDNAPIEPAAAAGERPAVAPAPSADPAAGRPANDPLVKQLETMNKRLSLQEQYRVRQEQEKSVAKLQETIEDEMDKHPIFKKPKVGEIAQQLVGRAILTNPSKPPAKVVEEVAAQMRAYEEEIKASFTNGKKEAARKIPAGVGSGGAAPPGKAAEKLSFLDGTTKKAFAAGLRSLRQEQE